ncbi:lipoprotein-releasing system permease protein [Filimonas lacunae]|uniref:Lipoprotein-releasing system permease protein n=1 Tax=Filimonas lacunae TaxID=477680 RepID=A0A173MJB3_9BACT|nr:ABC transporter permease [Filimonas lacunae]BAV07488.1 ABC transporter, permease protein [Filimonas lacunae]SIT30195.1 lipoprotein-releasing system permease protein [Filimonas lacunae]
MASVNFSIARVHLTSKVKQTIVALLGVTFGISMYIFMNSFMAGVNNTQTDLAFTSMAHIRIYNDGPADNTNLVNKVYPAGTLAHISNAKVIQYTTGIKNSAAIQALVQKQPEVTGVAPQVNINVFFRNSGNKLNGTLSGVDVESEERLFHISQYMLQGKWDDLKYRPDGVLLGEDLAQSLSVNMGDNINVLTSDGISHNYKLIGTFRTNVKQTDKAKAYINITAARQLLSENQQYVTDVQMNVQDYEKTEALVQRIAPVVPYKVESWQTANEQLQAGSKLRNIIAMAVSLTILLVAGFGIYNIMNMTINEKIREIAILKAMGFSGKDVTEIFLTQAIVIGVAGGAVGMTLGFTIAKIVNHIPFRIAGLNTLPMTYQPKVYIMAFVFGLITTFIAGYLPARKASKIDPVEIIRG